MLWAGLLVRRAVVKIGSIGYGKLRRAGLRQRTPRSGWEGSCEWASSVAQKRRRAVLRVGLLVG